MQTKWINTILLSFVLLDLALAIWGFFFPELWFSFFHNADYVDPQALLQRTAANWLAFFIIQSVALLQWQKHSWLLYLVAGCRLSDCLTDITCLTFSTDISIYGMIAFPIAGLGNLLFGVMLINFARKNKAST